MGQMQLPGGNSDTLTALLRHNFDELYSAFLAFGTPYYVDSADGDDDKNDGLSSGAPFKTIQKFVDTAEDGDRAIMRGTFTEAVTCAKRLAFIGAGPTPNACIWMESAAGDTLLTLTAINCLVTNIRFRIPTTGGIGISMTNSDFTVIANNIFQGRAGSYYAIYASGGSQWRILDNVFAYMNTATYGAAILGHSTTTIPAGIEIAGNKFHSNLRHVKLTMRQSNVHDNFFQEKGLDSDNVSTLTATTKLDVSGETSGAQMNLVTRNEFRGTYSISGGYKASGATDNWYGNKSDKVGTTGVTAEGTTTAVPA